MPTVVRGGVLRCGCRLWRNRQRFVAWAWHPASRNQRYEKGLIQSALSGIP